MKTLKKSVIVSTCMLLALSGCATNTTNTKKEITNVEELAVSTAKENFETSKPTDKEETVYVITDANGNSKEVLVSDILKNGGSVGLVDKTNLTNVTSTKNDLKYDQEDDTYYWDANGSDVYYQGISDKEVPFKVSIKYYLDDKEISPSDLAGKSGSLAIKVKYENNLKRNTFVDGVNEKMTVPMIMLSTIILDHDKFSNVKIDNGQVIDDGSRYLVIGVGLPGIQDDLNLSDVEIPDSFTLKADVSDCSIATIITLCSNDLLLKMLDEKDDSTLSKFKNTILGKKDELISGLTQLKSGSSELYDGLVKIDANLLTIKNGANTLVGYNNDLNNAAAQIFDGILAQTSAVLQSNEKLNGLNIPTLTKSNYSTVFKNIFDALGGDILAQVTAAYKQEITKQVKAGAKAKIEAAYKAEITTEVQNTFKDLIKGSVAMCSTSLGTYDSLNACVLGHMTNSSELAAVKAFIATADGQNAIGAISDDAIKDVYESAGIQSAISSTVDDTLASKSTEIDAKVDAYMNTDEAKEQISSILNSEKIQQEIAEEVKKQAGSNPDYLALVNAKQNLDSIAYFCGSLKDYTDNVSVLASGISQLYGEGTQKLVAGSLKLRNGIKELSTSLNTLLDTIDETTDRCKSMNNLAKSYTSFTEGDQNVSGTVKFIFRSDSIEK